MIKEVSFEECLPLLKKLWPFAKVIYPVDNHCGLIEFLGNEYGLMKPKYFLHYRDEIPVATTHCYLMGPETLRIRGTYCERAHQGFNIATDLIHHAISLYPEARQVMTFPRKGAERFYQSLGFKIISPPIQNQQSTNDSFIAIKTLRKKSVQKSERVRMIDFKRELLLNPPRFEALNPSLVTRFLTPDDRSALKELIESRGTLLKDLRSPEYVKRLMDKLDLYLKIDEPHMIVASFDGDKIQSCLALNFWDSLPYWSIFYVRSSPEAMRAGLVRGGLGNCFQYMHHVAIRLKRFRFYYMTRISPNAFKRKNHDFGPIQKLVPELRHYTYTTESVLPPRTAEEFKSFKRIQGEEVFDTSTYIGSGVLKEEALLPLHNY